MSIRIDNIREYAYEAPLVEEGAAIASGELAASEQPDSYPTEAEAHRLYTAEFGRGVAELPAEPHKPSEASSQRSYEDGRDPVAEAEADVRERLRVWQAYAAEYPEAPSSRPRPRLADPEDEAWACWLESVGEDPRRARSLRGCWED